MSNYQEMMKKYKQDYRELYVKAFEENQLDVAFKALGICKQIDDFLDQQEQERELEQEMDTL